MAAEQVHIIVLNLSDLALLARRRHDRRELPGATLHVQRVIVLVVLVTHSQQNIGVAESLRRLEGKYVARFMDVAERGDNFPRGINWKPGKTRVAPDRRIFLAITKLVLVTNRYFRPIW